MDAEVDGTFHVNLTEKAFNHLFWWPVLPRVLYYFTHVGQVPEYHCTMDENGNLASQSRL